MKGHNFFGGRLNAPVLSAELDKDGLRRFDVFSIFAIQTRQTTLGKGEFGILLTDLSIQLAFWGIPVYMDGCIVSPSCDSDTAERRTDHIRRRGIRQFPPAGNIT